MSCSSISSMSRCRRRPHLATQARAASGRSWAFLAVAGGEVGWLCQLTRNALNTSLLLHFQLSWPSRNMSCIATGDRKNGPPRRVGQGWCGLMMPRIGTSLARMPRRRVRGRWSQGNVDVRVAEADRVGRVVHGSGHSRDHGGHLIAQRRADAGSGRSVVLPLRAAFDAEERRVGWALSSGGRVADRSTGRTRLDRQAN